MTSIKVKLFALSTCSHCKSVKKLLARYNVDVDLVVVDNLDGDARDSVIKEVKHHNARISFPTTVIGDEVIVGYKADQIKKALERN
jgi:glutaredoxin-like protein NrdH